MPITGSDKALMYAQGGVARGGATRGGYHSAHAFVALEGTQIAKARGSESYKTLMQSLRVVDVVDEQPNKCFFSVMGIEPEENDDVVVTLGSINNRERLFAGHITRVQQATIGKPSSASNIIYHVSATDYTRSLGFKKVTQRYTAQSASAIVVDLITNYASVNGFTTANVVSGLETIDEITFTNEDVPTCLTRLAKRIGAYWYVDYHKDIHFFLSETGNSPVTLSPTHVSLSDPNYTRDAEPVVNRVTVEGRGSPVSFDTALGSTSIVVDDDTPFATAGGTVSALDAQLITYTGVRRAKASTAAEYNAPLNAPAATRLATGAGAPDETGDWRCKITFVDYLGTETTASPESPVVAITGPNDGLTIPLEVGPPGTTKRRIYLKKPSVSIYVLNAAFDVNNNTAGSTNVSAQTGGSSTQPPTSYTGPTTYPAGNTAIRVKDTSQFAAGGTARAASGELFTYTARSTSSGLGDLTGIPASGDGALKAAVNVGDPVVNMDANATPALTGVPASGSGSIAIALGKGTEVFLRVTVNDTSAQTALAAELGGDGIIEEFIQDRRLSETEATARANATLDLRSATEGSLTYRCRDLRTKAGRTIAVSGLMSIPDGSFKIQHVTISDFRAFATQYPTFSVEASTTRFSFEDLLRQFRRDRAA